MDLPGFQPTNIDELDKMLTIPGMMSGIDFIEKYHEATKGLKEYNGKPSIIYKLTKY